MSRQIIELEAILGQMVAEHRSLLALMETQQEAIKKCDLKKMDESRTKAEACRLRMLGLDGRRRLIVTQIAQALKIQGELTLSRIAELHPAHKASLLKLRTELRSAAQQVKTRTQVSGRIAGAVLGHLNTVIRIVAGSVGKAGLYNRRGVPRMASRIGVIETVG
jgi:hypothetical protein